MRRGDYSSRYMFTVSVGSYAVLCLPDRLPDLYGSYRSRAALVDEFALGDADGAHCFMAITPYGRAWPLLVVAQRYEPAGYGFHPGVLIVPETSRVFLGAGRRLLAYDLAAPARLWVDQTDHGFLGWTRHDDVVMMSAELELAAWDLTGRKLWTTFVEPPWDYDVVDGVVRLDVMGTRSEFSAHAGPGPTPHGNR